MRRLREMYEGDERVQALAAALSGNREFAMGACHGGIIAVLLAALAADRSRQWPRLVISQDPAALTADLEELGIVAAHLSELDQFSDENVDESVFDRSGHNRRAAALEAYAAGAVLVASPRAAE